MSGPKTTTFNRRPKSRTHASVVWRAAHMVLGFPPSWMRMTPARRYADTPDGRVFCETTMWVIGRSEDDPEPIIVNGKAHDAAEILLNGGNADA